MTDAGWKKRRTGSQIMSRNALTARYDLFWNHGRWNTSISRTGPDREGFCQTSPPIARDSLSPTLFSASNSLETPNLQGIRRTIKLLVSDIVLISRGNGWTSRVSSVALIFGVLVLIQANWNEIPWWQCDDSNSLAFPSSSISTRQTHQEEKNTCLPFQTVSANPFYS